MIRRHALPLGLFFLAPLVGEFLLGNLPILFLPLVFVVAPMYGGGALLIRELTRRRGRGWPSILILALGYGVLEEGLTTQSLFNPDYAGQHLLAEGYVPALGIGVPWTLFVVGIHVFWSIATPILMMEILAGERRTTPWLGRRGLIVTAVLFAAGIGINTAINLAQWPYVASPAQFAVTGALVVLLAVAGLLPRLTRPPRPGTAPRPLAVFAATLVGGACFVGLTVFPLPVWVAVGVLVAGVAAFLALVAAWSARDGWTDRHRLAIGAAALLTYAWHSFAEFPDSGGAAAVAVDLAGNAICTAGAVWLIWFTGRRLHHRSGPAADATAG
jgi:hypothetical protein